MSDRIRFGASTTFVAVLFVAWVITACDRPPRYETAGTEPAATDSIRRLDSENDSLSAPRQVSSSPIQAPPDSCVSANEVRYREGFTYHLGHPFTGVACSYYADGSVHTLTRYVNGRRSGLWRVYYPNGVIEKAGTIRSGVEDGPYIENFMNGNRRYEYLYDMGTKTGVWRSWYADGTPYTERHFQNGMLHGKVLVWDEQGQLAKEYDYVHGRLVNSVMHFEEQ